MTEVGKSTKFVGKDVVGKAHEEREEHNVWQAVDRISFSIMVLSDLNHFGGRQGWRLWSTEIVRIFFLSGMNYLVQTEHYKFHQGKKRFY